MNDYSLNDLSGAVLGISAASEALKDRVRRVVASPADCECVHAVRRPFTVHCPVLMLLTLSSVPLLSVDPTELVARIDRLMRRVNKAHRACASVAGRRRKAGIRLMETTLNNQALMDAVSVDHSWRRT